MNKNPNLSPQFQKRINKPLVNLNNNKKKQQTIHEAD